MFGKPTYSGGNEFFSEGLSHDRKYNLDIIKTDNFWYTKSFRPDNPVGNMVREPLTLKRNVFASGGVLLRGGTIVDEDEREMISDTRHDCWQVHGQLTMMFEDETYTGTATLITPWHALTAGHLLYDPEKEIWAKNIIFHPCRNGDNLLHGSVPCPKKAIFMPWKYGAETFDMGVVELAENIGNRLGWNGLLAGVDSFISRLDPVNVTGYPGDKPSGTMWTDYSKDFIEVSNQQLIYKLSTGEGQNGANLWVNIPEPNGFYSVGVHGYGVRDQEKGIFNIAVRLSYPKMGALVNLINNLL